MFIHIPDVLTSEEAKRCAERLMGAAWQDGRATAGYQAAKNKANLQLPEDSADARDLGDVVLRALERNALFLSAALPRYVFPPLFNRYDAGMSVGDHVDNALRQIPGGARRVRTDISATLFLNDPDAYDGGALAVEGDFSHYPVKLPAGDMILYPATTVHRVTPVTRGTRLAAVFWVQSLVKEAAARALLFDLDRAVVNIAGTLPDHRALVKLTACYHNLVRRYAET